MRACIESSSRTVKGGCDRKWIGTQCFSAERNDLERSEAGFDKREWLRQILLGGHEPVQGWGEKSMSSPPMRCAHLTPLPTTIRRLTYCSRRRRSDGGVHEYCCRIRTRHQSVLCRDGESSAPSWDANIPDNICRPEIGKYIRIPMISCGISPCLSDRVVPRAGAEGQQGCWSSHMRTRPHARTHTRIHTHTHTHTHNQINKYRQAGKTAQWEIKRLSVTTKDRKAPRSP